MLRSTQYHRVAHTGRRTRLLPAAPTGLRLRRKAALLQENARVTHNSVHKRYNGVADELQVRVDEHAAELVHRQIPHPMRPLSI